VSAISFRTMATFTAGNPDRMDPAVFFGFIAERTDAAVPEGLRTWLLTQRLTTEARLAVAGDRLRDVPVLLESPDDLLALFAPDARLDGPAEIAGAILPPVLPADAEPVLHVVIDGERHELALDPPQALADAIAAAGAPVTARLGGVPGAPSQVLARRQGMATGRITVFANPAYGFAAATMAESRAIGTPLGQAVRAFFAQGGRRTWVVRMGDPLPYLAARDDRWGQLALLLARGGGRGKAGKAGLLVAMGAALPSPQDPAETRSGLSHLFGLDDATFVLLPDLPELAAPPPERVPPAAAPPAPAEVFAPCVTPSPATPGLAASGLPPPALDHEGAAAWTDAVGRVLDVLRQPALRDRILIAALPRCVPGLTPTLPASAFLQLAAPWLRTAEAEALPGTLIAPDAVLTMATCCGVPAWRPLVAIGQEVRYGPARAPAPPTHANLAVPSVLRFADVDEVIVAAGWIRAPFSTAANGDPERPLVAVWHGESGAAACWRDPQSGRLGLAVANERLIATLVARGVAEPL
jgi:hypothetical protein